MTQYEMTEQLAVKCGVSVEEAMTALEASGWNTLTATHLLEQEKFRRMQELNAFAESGTVTAVQGGSATAVQGGSAAAVQFAPEEAAAPEAACEETPDEAQTVVVEVIEEARQKEARKQCKSQGLKNLGAHLRRLLACGNRNRFIARKGEEQLLAMPVTALVLLMLCAFWVCVPLLVIGLFAGCRYGFEGKELGREDINRVLGKATDAADHVKQTVAHA